MRDSDTASLLHRIPDPKEVARELHECTRRAAYLRSLLRLAERMARRTGTGQGRERAEGAS